ncbi:MAG: hypothetical protein ACRC33_25545 [Gemmataceae bacterium]
MVKARKKVAAVVTEYRRWSHADVILSKLLEGYAHDGKEMPSIELVSLYCDQKPKNDLAPALAEKHGFTLHDTVEGALTRGGKALAVDGVLSIGEHGSYPKNARGQILYPRRRFFEGILKVFTASKRSVPVFTDKHLAATWDDAKWMYDESRRRFVPLLAGSSVPLTWRRPDYAPARGTEFVGAVQIGYGPMEGYGFHALEGMQCLLERRKGGETGVRSVQAFKGAAMWEALDGLPHGKAALEAGLKLVPAHAKGDVREVTARSDSAYAVVIEYRDGLRAGMAMLNGWLYEGDGGAFIFGGREKDRPAAACQFYLQQPDPFYHFAQLLRAVEAMIDTGHAPYPVERTLLTTGVLDAAMTSLHEKGRKIGTPHLAIAYEARDFPHLSGPIVNPVKR